MQIDDMDRRGGEWLRAEGPHADVVVSSRIRLARNLAGFPFARMATEAQKREIAERVRAALEEAPLGPRRLFVELDGTDPLEARFLVERHLISRELESARGPRGVAFGTDEVVSVMVNEEDHLRVQTLQAALRLTEAWEKAARVDRALEARLDFAATPRHGYLTACPTNVGTGLRASVMLHLPALVILKQIDKVFQAAGSTGLAVRGFYGEGTMASGDLYQISNQVTLGRTEEEILRGLDEMLPNILRYEEACRNELKSRGRVRLEDRVHRARAVLGAARTLSSDEAMQLLSAVRLGVVLGILPGLDLPGVTELLVLTQPAHLQKLEGRALEPEERDVRRAAFVRARMG